MEKTKFLTKKKEKEWQDDFLSQREYNIYSIRESIKNIKNYFDFVNKNENYYLDNNEINYIKKLYNTLLKNKENYKNRNRIANGKNSVEIKPQTKDHKNW